MLDHVSISHKSGIVLWSKSYTPSASNLVGSSSNPINALLKDVLVEGRSAVHGGGGGRESYEAGGWKMEWVLENGLDLVFVVAYHRLLHLPYIPTLLETIKSLFLTLYEPFLLSFVDSLRDGVVSTTASDWEFNKLLDGWDKVFDKVVKKAEMEELGVGKARKPFGRKATPIPKAALDAVFGGEEPRTDHVVPAAEMPVAPSTPKGQSAEEIARNVSALKARLAKAGGGGSSGGKKKVGGGGLPGSPSGGGSESDSPSKRSSSNNNNNKPPAASKVMRKWGDSSFTESDMAALDFSSPPPPPSSSSSSDPSSSAPTLSASQIADLISKDAMGSRTKDGFYDVADLNGSSSGGGVLEGGGEDEEEDDMIEKALEKSRLRKERELLGEDLGVDGAGEEEGGTGGRVVGGMSSWFTRLTGGKVLTKGDLKPVLEAMEKHLMSKNVAKGIAEKMCEGVEKALVGRKLGGFGSVKSEVRASLSQSITRILTPKSSTDILLEIKRKQQTPSLLLLSSSSSQAKPDPYKMVFVGVNGVGKSTNLSKVCFWLLQNDLRVLIAACDTFRSGAVEQLRVHVRNLGMLREAEGKEGGEDEGRRTRVELFEKGYGKDSAGIAREAIAYAKEKSFDVVLIDTAGRMQDNEPLMRALAKLVTVNTPDKIVFVGEALVGNEAVDQLTKFDRSLRDFSSATQGAEQRGIDGMILTKFDTIDDKVGAALSMTYVTGQPILFVGCGQTYTDLRHIRVNHIVEALLKD
ncbi:SRP54-type protein [Mrakia frigida]|uniref:signal recognition particle receptor subunit alpha n=1 Tax=Mrakia frigida TaxID=29902 RepID=UPI003FCC228E